MKQIYVLITILVGGFTILKAQIYTPNGTIQGSSGNNNVGVGTSTPIKKIEVNTAHTYNIDDEIRIGSYYNSNFYGIGLNYQIDGIGSPTKHIVEYNGTRSIDLTLLNGNVGIGTIHPIEKLHISGSIFTDIGHSLKFAESSYPESWSGVTGIIDTTNGGGNNCTALIFNSGYGASSEKMRISNIGNVGIGTTNPKAKLEVVGNTYLRSGEVYLDALRGYTLNKLTLGDGSSSTFELAINGNKNLGITGGNVGIGTTNPDAKLEISGYHWNTRFLLHSVDVNHSNLLLWAGTPGISYTLAGIGNNINVGGPYYGRLNTSIGASFIYLNTGTINLRVISDTGTEYDGLTVGVDGNVGIGTTTPQSPLNIKASTGYGSLRISPNSDNSEASMGFFNDAAATTGSTAWVIGQGCWGNSGKFIIGNQVASGPIISVIQTGFVGIGTTTPSYKLDVNGEVGSVYFNASNTSGFLLRENTGSGYGIYKGATTRIGIVANGSEYLSVLSTGSVGIGTTNPQNKLDVNGTVHAKEFKASLDGWSDYVFAGDYRLMSLKDVENYIKANNKLPEVPSANEVKKDGVNLGEMNALLLKKVEELTLYIIELNKKHESLERKLNDLTRK